MKRLIALTLLAGAFGTAGAQTSVNVSVDIRQPGVYGRISIGEVPPPALILPKPIVIVQPSVVVPRAPIYLYVPTAHQHDWRRYCGRYDACGQPVNFVREEWVRERYEKAHPKGHPGHHSGSHKHDHHDHGKHKGKHKDKHG